MRSHQFLRRVLMTELFAYGTIAGAIVFASGLAAAWAVLIFAALWLGMRALVIAVEFAIAAGYADGGTTRIGPWAMFRCVVAEIARVLPSFSGYQAFPRQFAAAALAEAPPRGDPARPVVLLVPGFTCNPALFRTLRPALEREGLCVEVIELMPVFAPVASYVPQLAARIARLRERHGAERVHLIGHSMGGLVVRATIAEIGDDAIASVVTIGTPHAGTALARFSPSPNAADMRPSCGFVTRLAAASLSTARWLCIASDHDNLVAPARSALIDGASALRLAGVGHVSLISNPVVRRALVDWVARHDARPDAPGVV